MKNLGISYLLAALGLLTPVAGLHRFYLGKPVSGFFYLITWGFVGLGTIIDLIRLDGMVEDINLREHLVLHAPREVGGRLPAPAEPETEEQRILRAAKKHDGALTVAITGLETGLPLKQCQKQLDRLAREGHCREDVNEEGDRLYLFTGLTSKTPFALD